MRLFRHVHAFVTELGEDVWSLKPAMTMTASRFFGAHVSTVLQNTINVAPLYEIIVDMIWDWLINFFLEMSSKNFF